MALLPRNVFEQECFTVSRLELLVRNRKKPFVLLACNWLLLTLRKLFHMCFRKKMLVFGFFWVGPGFWFKLIPNDSICIVNESLDQGGHLQKSFQAPRLRKSLPKSLGNKSGLPCYYFFIFQCCYWYFNWCLLKGYLYAVDEIFCQLS